MNLKWTVLFLVHASNKQTRSHVRSLIKMLKCTHYSEEIKVLVLYGGLQSSKASGLCIQVTLHELMLDLKAGQLEFNEIQPGYGAIDIGDDKKLGKIFSEIRKKYPSERFLLFTWDHGSGFGIFKTDPGERNLTDGKMFIDFEMDFVKLNNSRSVTHTMQNIEFDVINNEEDEDNEDISMDILSRKAAKTKKHQTSMLTNDELRNIIMCEPGSKKVDLLIMMNCAMQMIETGFALSSAVEYLVAPETCIFWAGYDYISILNKLCASPQIETEVIGRYAVDTIEAYYENTTCKDYFNDLVVSLVKPEKSYEIKSIMDEISVGLNNELDHLFVDIRRTRKLCDDVTSKYVSGVPYHYIDLLNWIAELCKVSGNIDLERAKQVILHYVIHAIKGKNYAKVNDNNDIGIVNGCSIYYPPTSVEADADFYYEWFYKSGYRQTSFAAQSYWRTFLLRYFRYDRNNIRKKDIPK